jgi:hypothetical protein
MNKTPKFLNKDGSLTKHSFACGYMEVYLNKIRSGDRVTISGDPSHEFFYVMGFFNNSHVYKTFKKIKEARKFARQYGKLDFVKLP